jgi:hypothetical protein
VTNRNIYDVPTRIEGDIEEVDEHEDVNDECVGSNSGGPQCLIHQQSPK